MSARGIDQAVKSLQALQRQIWRHTTEVCEDTWAPGYSPTLEFFATDEGLQIRFFGDSHDDDASAPVDAESEANFPFCALLEWLSQPAHAALVQALHFGGPDSGANGIRGWEFGRLLQSEAVFPQLRLLDIQRTDAADHNLSIVIGTGDEDAMYLREGGMLAALLQRMPGLEELRSPSTPDERFFDGAPHPLRWLRVQSGSGHQDFIAHLARSRRFGQLLALDYAEVCPWQIEVGADADELAAQFTDEADFQALMEAPGLPHWNHFILRGTRLSADQLMRLQDQSKTMQFLYVPTQGSRYVSHWQDHRRRLAAQSRS
ncbi:MAG: hypothetical protein Q4G70_06295 [Pseudomonadota bacterium]|nr:hypothetical protein [Pseudomonadota bacterium]